MVFSTKYSLTLPAPALEYIQQVLIDVSQLSQQQTDDQTEIPEDEWAVGLELWAAEYLKGEVDDTQEADPSEVNVEAHFSVVDSFNMPPVRFDPVRAAFSVAKRKPSIAGQAASRSSYLRERWGIIREIILRNENFTPPALGGQDRDNYLKLFLLFGMLSRNPEGRLTLEDGDGRVVLDMEDAVPGEGLFTEGCMVLIEGEYTVDDTLRVLAMGHPPSEKRHIARGLHGHVDFLGGGAMSVKEEKKYQPTVIANTQVSFVVLSDVWLDHPSTLVALRRLFEGYAEAAEYRPMVFVLCGNFVQRGWEGEGGLKQYTNGFNALTDLILSFPLLLQSHFVFVPGPLDPWTGTTLPRPALPKNFTQRLASRIPKAKFVSNPCRLRYFGQDIVICREDLMGRMLRNLVGVKSANEGADMKRYTILDQAHLSPLPESVRPTLWEFDHALRLYPMPTAVVLADKYERYELTYEGCHVFNPGRAQRAQCTQSRLGRQLYGMRIRQKMQLTSPSAVFASSKWHQPVVSVDADRRGRGSRLTALVQAVSALAVAPIVRVDVPLGHGVEPLWCLSSVWNAWNASDVRAWTC
ncbi:epsilon DNA polymerase [Trichosporon asahii var. asahii CBS 8904]|uniref:DNA polymerase epsilon subunit B n=1 Tax=Trichosporon asahii var. asahii (strain CBS 8904) TaxID=1220162 RepID=K1VWN9_TRIAC|nr:epsilon DNA polymerase [Trichosporon asahii var. asahii CBS 8904]